MSSSATSGEVFLSETHLGCDSQWSMEPETNANGIWGHIRAVTNNKYLAIGNILDCEHDVDNGCEDEIADIRLVTDSTWLGWYSAPIYKKLWRRVGDQLVSKLGSMYLVLGLIDSYE